MLGPLLNDERIPLSQVAGTFLTPPLCSKYCRSKKIRVQLFYIPARDIEATDDEVPLKLHTLQGTKKFHQIQLDSQYQLKHRNLGCYCKYRIYCDCYSWTAHTFKKPHVQETATDANNNEQPIVALSTELIGKYRLVLYDDEPYVGQVMDYNEKDNDVSVKAVVRRGGNFLLGLLGGNLLLACR